MHHLNSSQHKRSLFTLTMLSAESEKGSISIWKEKKHLTRKKTDMSFIAKLGQHLIINTSNESVGLFDFDLNKMRNVRFSTEIEIHSSFIAPDGKRFALIDGGLGTILGCCSTDQKPFDILLPDEISNTFSLVCYWTENELIIAGNNNIHATISYKNQTIHLSDNEDIQKKFPDFYAFHTYAQHHSAMFQVNVIDRSFIERKDGFATFHTFGKNEVISISEPQNNYHDILFTDGYFVFIAELEVIIKNEHESLTIPHQDSQYFLRGTFIKTGDHLFLYLLSGDYSSQYLSTVTKYELFKK